MELNRDVMYTCTERQAAIAKGRSATIYNDKCLGTLEFGQWTLWDQLHLHIVRL